MARHASTYRQARRAVWKLTGLSWEDANLEMKRGQDVYSEGNRFGPVRSDYAGGVTFLGGRSKYMPHIGKKQRARNAWHPDGAMHRTPHEHRAFCLGA